MILSDNSQRAVIERALAWNMSSRCEASCQYYNILLRCDHTPGVYVDL
jgi:hypothetical protein